MRAIRREYDRLADEYDARWGRYVRESTWGTLARLKLPEEGSVLDLGCGTGVLLCEAHRLRPGLRLAGVDLSHGMLARARDRLPSSVHLVQAPGEYLPLASASLDLVVSVSSLHYWRDAPGVAQEVHRVLRKGGRFVLTDWCRETLAMRLRDLRFRWLDPAHGRTWTRAEAKDLLGATGFTLEGAVRWRIERWWELMTLTVRRG
ncbi:MAG: class I SAM-dependent methyltransferase [Gemmatimonadota bacterium]